MGVLGVERKGEQNLLKKIHSPQDLRKLSRGERYHLAEEIKEEIIQTVSITGGHLASNLGVVELTIALHYVFDSPWDKIIWDVGHQCYPHKLLTGRRASFHTLRQYDGLSGFPKREESPHDAFNTGHSSTSISAALGMSVAKSLKGDGNRVIAVIGDGSMTAGLAFEGLNQAGHLEKDLIVVLNDNEMSISPNVGALSAYLNRIMTGQLVNRFRQQLKSLLQTIPGIGNSMVRIIKQAEESFKGFLTPGILFEELGFKYVGPIDGHHIDHLIETFRNVKEWHRPILIHVITKKGKGYGPAELDPPSFHGVAPFNIETGRQNNEATTPISYSRVFGETMVKLAHTNPRIVAITAAMQNGTGLDVYAREFPNRIFDTGIAEQHAVTFAAGLASEGFRPVVAIYSTFFQRAYDQIVHDVCLPRLPVVFALDRSGIVGEDGPTHHGLFDISYLRHIPNLILMAPKDENEFQHMLNTAIQLSQPVAIRYPKGKGEGITMDETLMVLEMGKGEVLADGDDLLMLPVGSMVYRACEVARELREEGIYAAVINPRFIKPLDSPLLCGMAQKIGKIVTIEENVLAGGFGSAVTELLQEKGLSYVEVLRLGIPDQFLEHGPQGVLRGKCGLNFKGILRRVRSFLMGEVVPKKPRLRMMRARENRVIPSI
ncbi:MAG: 1-deoxy-D-xylulose-5-phosphate synthase [Syntrophobacterales bacterium]|nr:MAG: 1-deoxy-D-xylulose-5-phosphate synthase [Syntrophobacterales bacterium]